MPAETAAMLNVEEALERLLAEVEPLKEQLTGLLQCPGRMLSRAIDAPHSAPPFDNSAMDGFAVRAADLAHASAGVPVLLPHQAEVIAGAGQQTHLAPGKTIRINTGAPLPAGADAVVRIEDVELNGSLVSFTAPVSANQNIRRAGEDYKAGTRMLEPGRRLDPPAVGLLASLGIASVPVAAKPKVALLASGDELVDPGRPLGYGQIYNSTRFALLPLLASFGAEVHDLGRVGDDPAETRGRLAEGFAFDALITTGGVSMGSHDFIRTGLLELGAREIFWKVRQRPGKPMFIAKHGRTLCFGLPGNPVSVFVTSLLYVRAALLKMQGASDLSLPWRQATAAAPFKGTADLTTFSRANFASAADAHLAAPRLVPSSMQGSHQFSALSAAAGLVRIPEGTLEIGAENPIDFLEFSRLFR